VTQMGGALGDRHSESLLAAKSQTAQRENRWFAVRTRPRHEKKVAARLENIGTEVFLPVTSKPHQWSDRRVQVQVPLFTNYLFVRIEEERSARVPVLRTDGVVGFVGMGGVGVPIPDEQIQAVQRILRDKLSFLLCPFLQVGQKVRVRGGSLDGVEGLLLAQKDDRSLVISVVGIQQSLAIRIAGYEVVAA
jgi:transcription antitermination factor NusG